LVNRIASRYATKSFTGFDNIFPNAITVGQILSEDIIPTQEDKLSEDFQDKITQIDKTKTILLLTG
jgi:UDP-N-acetylglucosamine:LPS N-acetylglucosamine transferase